MMKIVEKEIEKYKLLKKGSYTYYAVDLTKEEFSPEHPIIKGCREVEVSIWNPREDFDVFYKKCDIISFIVYQDEIIGFTLISAWIEDIYGIAVCEEIMIRSEHHGKGLTNKLGWLSVHFLLRYYSMTGRIKQVVGLGLSVNPKTMLMLYRRKWLAPETTFTPTDVLRKVAWHYVNHHKYTPLDEDNPFFLKGVYPGSHKTLGAMRNEDILLKYGPPGFDYKKRGDCMVAMARHYLRLGRLITNIAMLFLFGPKVFLYKNLGWKLWEPKSNPLNHSYQGSNTSNNQ